MTKREFGNVRELPSGRWQARYRGPDGLRRNAPMTFKTKREATRWLALKEAEIARGDWINPDAGKVTVKEWGERWLASVKPGLKPKTYASYVSLFKTQVEPRFGAMTVSAVRPIGVSEWIASMNGRGLSASRIRQAYVVLSQIMETAVINELIKVSPCKGVKLPRLTQKEPRILTPAEVRKLAASAVEPHDLLIELLAFGGLRVGEAFALRRKHVDLENSRIRIAESLAEIAGKLVFGTPKSHQQREIKLPAFLVRKLRRHLEGLPPSPDALLFVNRAGNPLHYNAWRTWKFDPAVQKAALGKVTPHDLRATHATWVADRHGVMAAARRLGHSNASITTRHYARAVEARDDDIASGLDDDAESDENAEGAQTGHSPEDDDPPAALIPV